MTTFSITTPIVPGMTVLEASAGTGKTYAISALATKFIAEGTSKLSEILLITFSRSATAELRSRVRDKIERSTACLRAALSNPAHPHNLDELETWLLDGPTPEVEQRLARLEEALNRFDQAVIMTTHEFCQSMMRGLGVLAEQRLMDTLVEELQPLALQAAADVFVRRYSDGTVRPTFAFEASKKAPGATRIASDVVRMPAEILPADQNSPSSHDAVAFARQVKEEVSELKKRSRQYSFDDQLTRLRDALRHPVTGRRACRTLAERFPIVMIDEFQDTDPVQWQVVNAAFGQDSSCRLVVIGDPKQSVYAFRGGDVHTYNEAARGQKRLSLSCNYRSDTSVVDAVDALFHNVLLGDNITLPRLASVNEARLSAEPGSPWQAGIQVRTIDSPSLLTFGQAPQRISRDVAHVVASLLGDAPPVTHADGRRIVPHDIAILVRSNWVGDMIAKKLASAAVPVTFSGSQNVFDTPAAEQWITLLTAMGQPHVASVRRAVLTDFIGGTVTELATAADDQQAQWSLWIFTWAKALRQDGVWAALAAIDESTGFSARLLSQEGGERRVTDVRHVAELLHEHQIRSGSQDPSELARWLSEHRNSDESGRDRTRRLETDADTVTIMTIHRAKGLQFPIVLIPDMAQSSVASRDAGHPLWLPVPGGRVIDVGGSKSYERDQRWQQHSAFSADEELRVLYVALTRAASHAVAWWAPHKDVWSTPLHRLLHAHDASETGAPARPHQSYVFTARQGFGSPTRLAWLPQRGIAVTPVAPNPPAKLAPRMTSSQSLTCRTWNRWIDPRWRRTSYSGLTAQAHDEFAHAVGVLSDETDAAAVEAPSAFPAASPMANVPSGPAFGTLVHTIFEYFDPRPDDWHQSLRTAVTSALARWPIPDVTVEDLATALEPSFETPLGPLSAGTTLRDYGPGNRLSELDFEFAMRAPHATLNQVAEILAADLPPGHPLAAYPGLLREISDEEVTLSGFLNGSIDSILRTPEGAFLVVDYKTNNLGHPGEPLTLGHYTQPALSEAMMHSHYPLQAILYSVALHRFLSARLPDYEPHRHLGGIAYLFLRGMGGPDTPVVDTHPTGVFSWRPSPDMVCALSDLFAGGAS